MLEQVGEACSSRLFVLGPDVIPEIDRNDRQRSRLVDDHPEAIVQKMLSVRNLHGARGEPGQLFLISPEVSMVFPKEGTSGSSCESEDSPYVHHRTAVSGMVVLRAKLAIEISAAVRSAAAMNAFAATECGSLTTSGTPLSLPSRMG